MDLVKLSMPVKYNKLHKSQNMPKQNIILLDQFWKIESNCDGAGDDRGSPTPYMPTGMLLYIIQEAFPESIDSAKPLLKY